MVSTLDGHSRLISIVKKVDKALCHHYILLISSPIDWTSSDEFVTLCGCIKITPDWMSISEYNFCNTQHIYRLINWAELAFYLFFWVTMMLCMWLTMEARRVQFRANGHDIVIMYKVWSLLCYRMSQWQLWCWRLV